MAKTQTIRRVVRISQVTADRIDIIAERMGMTPAQALQVMVAQGAASAARGIELVDSRTSDVLGTFIQGELKAVADASLEAADREHDEVK